MNKDIPTRCYFNLEIGDELVHAWYNGTSTTASHEVVLYWRDKNNEPTTNKANRVAVMVVAKRIGPFTYPFDYPVYPWSIREKIIKKGKQ